MSKGLLVIIGASTDVGQLLALEAVRRDWRVLATDTLSTEAMASQAPNLTGIPSFRYHEMTGPFCVHCFYRLGQQVDEFKVEDRPAHIAFTTEICRRDGGIPIAMGSMRTANEIAFLHAFTTGFHERAKGSGGSVVGMTSFLETTRCDAPLLSAYLKSKRGNVATVEAFAGDCLGAWVLDLGWVISPEGGDAMNPITELILAAGLSHLLQAPANDPLATGLISVLDANWEPEAVRGLIQILREGRALDCLTSSPAVSVPDAGRNLYRRLLGEKWGLLLATFLGLDIAVTPSYVAHRLLDQLEGGTLPAGRRLLVYSERHAPEKAPILGLLPYLAS